MPERFHDHGDKAQDARQDDLILNFPQTYKRSDHPKAPRDSLRRRNQGRAKEDVVLSLSRLLSPMVSVRTYSSLCERAFTFGLRMVPFQQCGEGGKDSVCRFARTVDFPSTDERADSSGFLAIFRIMK